MLGGNRSLRHSNRDQRLPHLLVSEQNLILHRIAPYCLQCQQHTVVHHDTAKAAGSAVLTRTLRRLVRMQAVCALAQRKLRITATSTSFASPGRSTANSNSYSAALLILASRQECSWLTQSLASVARTFSQAAVAEQPQADIQLTEAAVERLQELNQQESNSVLRLKVDAGGCSGFSYVFDLEKDPPADDIVVQQKGVQLVTDTVSYELLKGAVVDYTTDLIRASFEVVQNPNASGKCGCGASFEPKI